MSVAILLMLAAIVSGDPPLRDYKAALARPVSPGTIAMLVGHLGEAPVAEHLAEALQNDSAAVRTTAARVIAVSGGVGLRDRILAQLEREADVAAAAELLRAAVLLGAPADDPALRSAARRHAGALDVVLAETIVRTHGVAALVAPGLLQGLAVDAGDRRLFRLALRGDPAEVARAIESLARTGNAEALGDVLSATHADRLAFDVAPLLAAANAPSAGVRARAYLELVSRASPPTDVAARLQSTPEATAPEPGSDAGFAFELLQRRLGRAPRADSAWLARVRSGAALDLEKGQVLSSATLRLMTSEERRTLAARDDFRLRATDDKGRQLSAEEAYDRVAAQRPPDDAPLAPRLRLASGLPTGLVADLVRLADCKAKAATIGYAHGRYRGDGRPAQITLLDVKLSQGCEAVARAALPLVLAWGSVRPDQPDVLALPLDPDEPGCDERPIASLPVAAGSGRLGIEPPRKIRNVAPEYPAVASLAGRQGVVILEATISESGCVREVELLRGAHPSLDGAAVRAVSRWRYSPTLLDGRPVPVFMTVTVNFRVQRSPLGSED